MGLLSIFKGNDNAEVSLKQKGFDVASCDFDCGSCANNFPSSVKVEEDGHLYGSSKPFGLQIIVPTGKTDWQHDATSESGTVAHVLANWAAKSEGKFPGLGENTNIKVAVSSLTNPGLDSFDEQYTSQRKADILLLPLFVWVKGVTVSNAEDVLDRAIPQILKSREAHVSELPFKQVPGYKDVEVSAALCQSYVFLCSHRTRDKRCGITAPIMKKEMDIHLRELGLIRDHGDFRPGGVTVTFINHVGGHKYSANVIIFNKKNGKNIWLARCRPNNVVPIIDECIVGEGNVWPEQVRVAQKFTPISW